MPLDISKIKQVPLTANQYYQDDCTTLKKQIVLHHTAGAPSAANTISGWQADTIHVATAFVIAGKPGSQGGFTDGEIYQTFSSKNWAYHLAFSKRTNKVPSKYHSSAHEKKIAMASIGIEICNWGQLTKQADGTFKNYVGGIVPAAEVIELATPHRGFKYYHAYTDAQLAAVKDLLIYLADRYHIPKTYHAEMFDISTKALDGEAGIWTHTSYRSDKFDCSPQPKLIAMLQSL